MDWLREVQGIKKAAEWWWAMTRMNNNVMNKNRGYQQLTNSECYELNDNRPPRPPLPTSKFQPPMSPVKKRASTARPVVIVESVEPKMFGWVKYDDHNFAMTGPVVNMNEQYIEVYYTTDSQFSFPGKLERYKKKLCYCCDQCPACQIDRQHRQLHQVSRRRRQKC